MEENLRKKQEFKRFRVFVYVVIKTRRWFLFGDKPQWGGGDGGGHGGGDWWWCMPFGTSDFLLLCFHPLFAASHARELFLLLHRFDQFGQASLFQLHEESLNRIWSDAVTTRLKTSSEKITGLLCCCCSFFFRCVLASL